MKYIVSHVIQIEVDAKSSWLAEEKLMLISATGEKLEEIGKVLRTSWATELVELTPALISDKEQ